MAILDTGNIQNPIGGQATFCRAVIPHLGSSVTYWGCVEDGLARLECSDGLVRDVKVRTRSLARQLQPGQKRLFPDRVSCLLGAIRHRREILENGDVVYVQSPELGLPFVVGREKKPVVVHLHGAGNPAAVSKYRVVRTRAGRTLYGWLMKFVVSRASVVLSVDSAGVDLASMWRRGHRFPPALIPSCYEAGTFYAEESVEPGNDDGRVLRIVYVGRLEAAKGVDKLLDALELLTQSVGGSTVGFSLTVIGDGSLRSALEQRSCSLSSHVSVKFTGWLSREQTAEHLRRANLMVLPSMGEGLPISVLESLACGVPVVACDAGDIRCVVQEGVNGYVTPTNEPGVLAEAIKSALSQEWDRLKIVQSVAGYKCSIVGDRVRKILEHIICVPTRND